MMITEEKIESVLLEIETDPELYTESLLDLKNRQPVIAAYLFSESFDVLTNMEKEYLLYLTIVVWRSIQSDFPELPVIDEDTLGEFEERNWDLMNQSTGKPFRHRLDVFFEDTPQEDLLAFVEDALLLEDEELEEWQLTKECRTPLFIGLKSIIDSLQDQIQKNA